MTKTTCKKKYLIGHLLKVSEDKSLTIMVGSMTEGRRLGIGAVAERNILPENWKHREDIDIDTSSKKITPPTH